VIGGEASVEVGAPVAACFALAADIERAPDWQGGRHRNTVLERDAAGRPSRVRTSVDISVKEVGMELVLEYDEPRAVSWRRVAGDLKELTGSWRFEELGPHRTRATYATRADPGRVLGPLVRGPVAAKVYEILVTSPPEGLRRELEG
jgi:ribosome-associated toxin RatA of RatAB toxin-antitoxin module